MAVSYGAVGAVSYSTGNPTPAYPTGITAGQYLLLLVASKPDDTGITTPTGFTNLGSLYAGYDNFPTGIDQGPTTIRAYGKIAVGTETGTLTVTIPNNNVSWAQILRITNATGGWAVATAVGEDAISGGSGWTANMLTNPGLTAGDLVVGALSVPTDAVTMDGGSITAPGVTVWGTATEVSVLASSLGQDISGHIHYRSVTTGTSTGVPVATANAIGTTTHSYGPHILVRLREAAAGGGGGPAPFAAFGIPM